MDRERFEEILAGFRDTCGAESTATKYTSHVETWREWLHETLDMGVLEAEPRDLRLYIEQLDDNRYASATIEQHISGISKFYQFLETRGRMYGIPDREVPSNPYDGLNKQDKQPLRGDTKKKAGLSGRYEKPYLHPDKIKELYEHAPAPRLRNELIVKLLYNCGLRREELAKIKLEHLDRHDRVLDVPARKSPEPRWVTFNEDYVGFQLTQWLEHGRDAMSYANESEYLFPTNNAPHISTRQINAVVKKAADNAGLQEQIGEYSDGRPIMKVTPHTLRHSYAMQMIESGVKIKTLQTLMGHEELDTTMIYLQQSNEDAVQESRKFSPEPTED